MRIKRSGFGLILAGAAAGAVNGLFGGAGGMVLVPLLTLLTDLNDGEIFPASVITILPLCLISLFVTYNTAVPDWQQLIPYLIGSVIGGLCAGYLSKKLSTTWLHRFLGALIIWGGIRYLC